MAETLSILSVVFFVLAGVFFALAVFLWFFFKIPGVIGDLNGRTARKSIAKMRENNEKSGKKTYRSSPTNLQRGKLTDTIPQNTVTSERLAAVVPTSDDTVPMQVESTELMGTDRMETGVLEGNQAIPQADVTAALGGNVTYAPETAPLNAPAFAGETALLNDTPGSNETELLTATDPSAETASLAATAQGASDLVMMEQVMLIHTNEVIPL